MRTIVASAILVALSLSTGPLAAQQQMTGTGDFCIMRPGAASKIG
jgi:hypothetical protein